jgi:CHAD domain-containing protein
MTPDFPAKPLSESARRRLDRAIDSGYRLRIGETAAEGVRRVAHGRVDSALDHLRRGTDVDVAVHEARKDLKKLRSLLRLVRADLGGKRYRAENARYRDAARLLSGLRDAEVLLETLAALRECYPERMPPAERLQRALEDERSASRGGGDLDRRLEQAAEAIAAGAADIDSWKLASDGFELLRPGVERSYRRGRKHLRALGDGPSDEAIHQWRKRVKDLWYQLRLLQPTWPAALKGPVDAAHDLADLLGDHHDLAMLAARVGERTADDPDAAAVIVLARARQDELLAAARPLAICLYAEKPRRFAGRLAVYWGASRLDG